MKLITLTHYRNDLHAEDWVTIAINPSEISAMAPVTFEPLIPHDRGDTHLITGTRIYMKGGWITWLVQETISEAIAKLEGKPSRDYYKQALGLELKV